MKKAPKSAATAAAVIGIGGERPRRGEMEEALRQIVEAHALAMWANSAADQETYERLANDRDDAIEAAARLIGD